MRVVMTVEFVVDVPHGTRLDDLGLNLDVDNVLVENGIERLVGACVVRYGTTSVSLDPLED